MAAGTTTLNAGSGGDSILNDSLTTVDGVDVTATLPGARAQAIKQAFGAQGTATFVRDADGARLPVDSPALGAPADAEAASGNGSIVSLLKNLRTRLSALPTALGPLLRAQSLSVALASDHGGVPVAPNAPSLPMVTSSPTTQSIASATAVQYGVTPGATVLATVTSAPGATTAFTGTIQFETSVDGSTWSPVNAVPLASLPGAGLATVTQTTAVGLWVIQVPLTHAFIRFNCTAYTSGTAWTYVEPWGKANGIVQLPWRYTVTSGQTLMGWIEASAFNEIMFVVGSITTTVLTVQGTNDPTGANVQTLWCAESGTLTLGQSTIASAGAFRVDTRGFKWVRIQVTTTGTALGVQGITARMGQPVVMNAYGQAISASVATVTNVTTVGTLSSGQTAHSSASTGNPVRVGGRVITTIDTSLTQGDASDLAVTTGQQLVTKPFASAENDWRFTGSISTTTTAAAANAAGGTNVRNYVTDIQAQNTSATATTLLIVDGSTTIWQCNLPANMPEPIAISFQTPLRGTANTAMNYNFGTAGATVLLNIQGYRSF